MCGIAGLLAPPGSPIERAERAANMAATLVHRGPDDFGSWADPRGEAAFGFQRLSILDLTPEGHQPMTSSDGRFTVVFNGEIYNSFAYCRPTARACHVQFLKRWRWAGRFSPLTWPTVGRPCRTVGMATSSRRATPLLSLKGCAG